MIRVAFAGSTGLVSKEIVHILAKSGRHELQVFTRSTSFEQNIPNVTFINLDYDNKDDLADKLRGVHTLLCFISDTALQRRLIDTCIEVGVKRFEPNQCAAYDGTFGSGEEDEVYEYLKNVNGEAKALEYCLFQPGLFMNCLSSPIPSATYHPVYTNMWDIQNRHALQPEDADYQITLTTIQDLGRVLDEAFAYGNAWLEVGGITGSSIMSSEIIKIAESIRGPFKVEKVSMANIEAGKLGTDWETNLSKPANFHATQDWDSFTHYVVAEIMRGGLKGAWDVSDEWNQLLPHLGPTSVEEFLQKFWKDWS